MPRLLAVAIVASFVAGAPFLLSLASRATTYIRFSRLRLPAPYLRTVRLRALLFHAALLLLLSVLVYDIVAYGRRREHTESSNQAPALTRLRRDTAFAALTPGQQKDTSFTFLQPNNPTSGN